MSEAEMDKECIIWNRFRGRGDVYAWEVYRRFRVNLEGGKMSGAEAMMEYMCIIPPFTLSTWDSVRWLPGQWEEYLDDRDRMLGLKGGADDGGY